MSSLSTKIFSASALLTLSNGLVRLLSLITMPILTHLLAPSAYGVTAMVGTMISLVSVFALAGMDMSYIRSFGDKSSVPFQKIEIFAWRFVLWSGVIAAICAVILWSIMSSKFSLPSYIGFLVGGGIWLLLINTMAQARARIYRRYRAISLSIVVSGFFAMFVSVASAFWWRQDELPLLLAMLTNYFIPIVVLGTPALTSLSRPSGIPGRDCLAITKIGIAGIITAPAYWFLSSSDRWLLGYFEGAASVGVYSVGFNVAVMGMMINKAMYSVWTPEVVTEFKNNPVDAPSQLGKTAERVVCAFACVCLAVIAAGGDVIRLLAAPSFHDAVNIVPFIALTTFFHGLTHLASAILLLLKKMHLAVGCWIVGAVICLVLNLVLIPLHGQMGAALTQAMSMAFVAGTITLFAQNLYPLQIRWVRMLLILICICGFGFWMDTSWADQPFISLSLKLPVGVFAVFFVVLIISPNSLKKMYKRVAFVIIDRM